MVPKDLKSGYISRRFHFFRNLVDYATKHNYSAADIINFRQSLNRLEQLALETEPKFS